MIWPLNWFFVHSSVASFAALISSFWLISLIPIIIIIIIKRIKRLYWLLASRIVMIFFHLLEYPTRLIQVTKKYPFIIANYYYYYDENSEFGKRIASNFIEASEADTVLPGILINHTIYGIILVVKSLKTFDLYWMTTFYLWRELLRTHKIHAYILNYE